MAFIPHLATPHLDVVPDTVSLCDFMLDDAYGRHPVADSASSYICASTGREVTAKQQVQHVEWLARSLAKEMNWSVNHGKEFDKVVAIFATNTVSPPIDVENADSQVDAMTISWAAHRLNGVSTPANAAYSVQELYHQLKTSGAQCLFTVKSLLKIALKAAKMISLPTSKIFLCESECSGFKTLEQLLEAGRKLPVLEKIRWMTGQGARQCAFLCYSSGTSGLPKAVMIPHRNVIANILQIQLFERKKRHKYGHNYRDVALGLLPQSHIYSLILVCHASTYFGDTVIIMSKFLLNDLLKAIETYQISTLYLVPPIIITMMNNLSLLKQYDLSSVKEIFSGAAPLAEEVSRSILVQYPSWKLRQAYGMTETCVVVTSTDSEDVWLGSSGCLLPGFEIKLVRSDGSVVTEYNQPGEVLVKSPSVVLGYLNNDAATAEAFIDLPEGRFIRTGDEGEMRLSPQGTEHLWIVDRIKELIKVKGHQVAPAELEACLLSHPNVSDCAVIAVPDDLAGERPKAFIVKTDGAVDPTESILRHVESQKARYKWITGGVEFVETIPKSPSGKILRRLLRDQEKEKRRQAQARL